MHSIRSAMITGWLNDEGEVEEVSVDGDTVFSTDSRYLPDVEIVVSYHTFPGEEESSTEDENSNSESNENETSENTESTNEAPEENLTPENNEDLAAVLSATNELDPIYSEFAEKYKNQIIEFDACITYLTNHGDNLFLSKTGKPLTDEAIARMLKQAAQAVGVSNTIRVSPHTCRHTFAQIQLKNGLDLYSLSRIMGHTNISITQRYLQGLKDKDIVRRGEMYSPLMNL